MTREQDTYEMYIDDALVALGGDEAPDYIISSAGAEIACPECGPLYTIGQIELWEAVADARKHTEQVHTTAAVIKQKQDERDAERMGDEHG